MIFGIKENKSFENVIFTYVVDSDESLAAWVNNDPGNDYSCVLIKKGEWTSSKNLDLTITGTKIIIGEADSKLIFNIAESTQSTAILYSTIPEINEHFMFNVNLVCNREENAIGFNQCVNLYNCSVEANGGRASGFYKCENVINCVAKCNATGTEYSVPFYFSNGLNNCVAFATAQEGTAYGFSKCEKLNNCKVAELSSNVKVCGFNNCNVCVGCTFENDVTYHAVNGFFGCKKLFACIAVANGTTEGNAFYGCGYIDGCEASGNYGYYNCYGIKNCIASETSVAKAYNTSANIGDYNATYAYANTPNGGFNN